MASQSWSTSNFYRLASGLVTATPLTIACWAKSSITASSQLLGGLFTSGSITTLNSFLLGVNGTPNFFITAADGASGNSATSTATITANTWTHYCAVFASATSRSAFVNGGSKATASTSKVPAGINRTSIGAGDGSSTTLPWAPAGTGDIAHYAIWNIDLSDAEVLRLSTGISPLCARRESLVGYWPLLDISGVNVVAPGSPQVMQGTLTQSADAPAYFMPNILKTLRGR